MRTPCLLLLQLLLGAVAMAAAATVDEVPIHPSAAGAAPSAEWGFWDRLPGLFAACVLAGLVASQAVYYDDDGEPTGVSSSDEIWIPLAAVS
eukprot:SAG31_NODE_12591_length_931_cov_0.889423_2_plen_92_part_00